ncbi:TPA: ArpU family phage packaging/lysis transcriptional regulator, partial [Listeria innocua]
MKNSIDYIKTVQNVKRFFEEFQYLVFLLGPRNKIKLNSEGIIEEKLVTDDSSYLTAIGKLVQLYT